MNRLEQIEARPNRIKSVYVWDNGMVMVFDQDGEQMPQLQGKVNEVWLKVKQAADADTIFYFDYWLERREFASE